MAKDEGIPTLANVIMLGHLLENNPELNFAGTDAVVNKLVPPKKAALIELNMKALNLGKEYK
jgi:2-oxoglutarate ferredoxin oxidoreductase subunit gamma